MTFSGGSDPRGHHDFTYKVTMLYLNCVEQPNQDVLCKILFELYSDLKVKNQCATRSKILTEPEQDRIGIILAGTGPELDRIKSLKNLTGLAGF